MKLDFSGHWGTKLAQYLRIGIRQTWFQILALPLYNLEQVTWPLCIPNSLIYIYQPKIWGFPGPPSLLTSWLQIWGREDGWGGTIRSVLMHWVSWFQSDFQRGVGSWKSSSISWPVIESIVHMKWNPNKSFEPQNLYELSWLKVLCGYYYT